MQGFQDSPLISRLYITSKFFIYLFIFVGFIFSVVKMWFFFLISAFFMPLFWKHTKDLPKWKYYSQFCTEYARAPFLMSLFICRLCVLLFCKENVFCHIHELQISFSWTGRTDSSSFSSQQSIIPLLSHCLSFIFPPYLFLSPHGWANLPGILDGNYIL